jgi:hypothetical protein
MFNKLYNYIPKNPAIKLASGGHGENPDSICFFRLNVINSFFHESVRDRDIHELVILVPAKF